MKRAAIVVLISLFAAMAQEPGAGKPPDAKSPAPPDAVEQLHAAMRAAEAKVTTLRMVMTTKATLPGDLTMETRGSLHVLRGTQPQTHVVLEYRLGDSVKGRSESGATADGIVVYEEDPAFGEVHYRIDAKVVADLTWAGDVLQKADLPGMQDPRANTPLGSGLLAELRRRYDLVVDARAERAGERGTWLAGARKAGLGGDVEGLMIADRAEVFVRAGDHALLELREWRRDQVVQQLVVESLQVGGELGAKAFAVDGRGQRLRDVQQHLPMWEQIQRVLEQAEAKSADGVVRPSRRPARGG